MERELIIFDLDGTLLDSDQMIFEAFRRLFKKYRPEYNPSEEYMQSYSGPMIMDTFKREFPGCDLEEVRKDFYIIIKDIYNWTLKEYPGAFNLISRLKEKGFKVALATNKPYGETIKQLGVIGIHDIFDVVLCGDLVTNPKPHREMIETIMKKTNVIDKSKVLYIGDSNFDYLTAKNSCVDLGIVNWSPRVNTLEGKAKYYIDSFDVFEEQCEL